MCVSENEPIHNYENMWLFYGFRLFRPVVDATDAATSTAAIATAADDIFYFQLARL